MMVPVERVNAAAFTIPTDAPESNGTFAWNSTTLVLLEVTGGGRRGIGYTYADNATAELIRGHLAEVIVGRDALAIPAIRMSSPPPTTSWTSCRCSPRGWKAWITC